MHCAQCGTLITDDAKFCFKCGTPVGAAASEQSSQPQVLPAKLTRPRALWLYIVGVLLIGTYAAMFIPALVGLRFNPQAGPGSMLWTGLLFYLWWKRRDRKGWHGALIGAAVGLAAFFLAAFIGGAVRGLSGT